MTTAVTSNAIQTQRLQAISDRVWEKYQELRELSNMTLNSKLDIKKTTKVKIEAIKRNLIDFKNLCQDEQLKTSINGICHDLDNMPFDGTTQLFTAHNVKKTTSNKIEFICCAIKRYEYKDQFICDYCLCTFTYSKFIDYVGVAAGASIGAIGMGMGAICFTGLATVTGGIGPIMLYLASGALGFSATAVGGAVIAASVDTDFEGQFRDILEASFLYELVQRGHAIIKDRTVFITHDRA